MFAKENLVAAYDAWEQWTHREGGAIQAGDWRLVSECQTAKRELQGRVIRLTEAANAEAAQAGHGPQSFDPGLRRIVNGLIALEARNAGLLADRRQTASVQMADLDQAGRNLKQVRKSYGQPSRMAWQSYS